MTLSLPLSSTPSASSTYSVYSASVRPPTSPLHHILSITWGLLSITHHMEVRPHFGVCNPALSSDAIRLVHLLCLHCPRPNSKPRTPTPDPPTSQVTCLARWTIISRESPVCCSQLYIIIFCRITVFNFHTRTTQSFSH